MQRNPRFIQHLTERYPDIDVSLAIKAFDSQVQKVQTGPNAPTTVPLGSDLPLNIFIAAMKEYVSLEKEKTRETEDDDIAIPGYNH